MTYQANVPTCEIGHWEPLHSGCPVCGPHGPCADPEYEALIQANLETKRFRKTLFLVCILVAVAFALTACEPKRVVTALPIPPERTDCEAATGKRPQLNPEYRIDWSKVASVGQAKIEHDRFVSVIRGREGVVANYVISLEGDLFQCANDAAWVREWNAETR